MRQSHASMLIHNLLVSTSRRGHHFVFAALVQDIGMMHGYNRATYLKERVVLMQEWADLLDRFRQEQVAFCAA
jgi:hypothetical protein